MTIPEIITRLEQLQRKADDIAVEYRIPGHSQSYCDYKQGRSDAAGELHYEITDLICAIQDDEEPNERPNS